MKALERMCIVLITAGIMCTLASILFSFMEYEELNGVAGHITCILSVGAIATAFALMSAQENEKNSSVSGAEKSKNTVKAENVKPDQVFAEYILYDETEAKSIEN